MLCVSAAYAVAWCLSVGLSRLCILPKRVDMSIFVPLGSHTILDFPHQTLWQYSDGDHSNGGIKCRWGRQKSRCSTSISLHQVLSTLWPPNFINTVPPEDRGKLVTLIPGTKQWSLLMAGDDDKVFMTRSLNVMPKTLNVMPKTTEQHLIVCSGTSEAKVTTNRRLRLMYCGIEANYWQTRSIARPLCNSRATFCCYFILFITSTVILSPSSSAANNLKINTIKNMITMKRSWPASYSTFLSYHKY